MSFETLIGFGTVSLLALQLSAQPFLPTDVGTTVNGFQDDFTGTALGPNWVVRGANVFSVSGSLLHVAPATGDPNHLLYEAPGYDNTVQEVLARIRVLSLGSGDYVRGGLGVAVDPASTQGINYLFRDNASDGQTANHMSFLDDMVAWGPAQGFVWQPNTWYWVRLRHEPNAASQGGLNDVFGKIWLADGTQPEPVNWQLTWNYTPTYATRTGYAGITASSGGPFQFDVDYILIKAAGLPSIFVAPNSFVQVPVSITNQPQNQTVMELSPAVFSVGAAGYPPATYQWFTTNGPISAATNFSYRINSAPWSANGSLFYVVAQNIISNVTYAATSSIVSLNIIADTNPPVLLGAQTFGLGQVQVSFSKGISPTSASSTANFAIVGPNGSILITNASLDASQTNVILGVSGLTDGALYLLTVNNVTDQSHAANLIAPNSQAQFLASPYARVAIGNPALPGSQVPAGNGYNISAGGSAIGGTNDQFQLSYQLRTGDFDVQVRLDALGLTDAWSEAGLMAREDLSAGGRFAAALATPSISGAFFESRNATNGAAALSGSFPVNYPNTWLRLKRAGNLFTGFGSFDGQNWTQLGSVTLALPSTMYFGFVVCSDNINQAVTAAFRDFGPVTNTGSSGAPFIEALGQCSRRTSLVISEIMYHPTNSALEFVELFNSRAEFQDLSGYQLAGSINYTFPPGTVISGGGFIVVARSPSELESAYGSTGILGPYTNNLPNGAGTVRLLNQAGAVLLEVNYSDQPPWPAAADGAGHSLVLARPSYGEDNVLAWAASDAIGGSPGRLDPVTPDPLRNVMINEFLAHTDPPDHDYIELYNHSSQPVDISGCILTDDAATNKFVIPSGTILQAGGFTFYIEINLNFALNAAGETIYLKNPQQTRILDAVRFEAQENGVATGRVPDGGERFYRLAAKSPGAANGAFRQSDIVINEIMYAPISLNDDDQYVELYNRGTNLVNLGGWQFISGVNFTFPANIVLPPDGYLVIARNAARMLTNYPNLNSGNLVGNFSGALSHKGERLALAKPDTIVATNNLGIAQTNQIAIVMNEVTYGSGGRWGQWSDAGGSSLELIDPHADNRLAPNWADSDETHKSQWAIISATGTLDNGNVPPDELQVLLQGVGEALVDNVQVLDTNGYNLITNGTFETGAAGWFAEGTEKTSGLETAEGFNGSQSYHLRAVEKADNQINRVRTLLSTALAAGNTNVTIHAAVRWLKGDPEILLRLRGNWLECAAELPTPANLGTPGARNSRYLGNAAPAITGVSHSPVLPAANQSIVVTARLSDPDGLASATLNYRIDPGVAYSNITMTDDGTGGDAVAGDGVYTATIPGQPAGTMIAFYVQAGDQAIPSATATFPNDVPARECLVRVGELQPTGNYPVYRVWTTRATMNTWNSNSKLDNSFNDMTFVLGNSRVIYNAGGRYKGSPYISPGYCGITCGRCGYSFTFPADDLFLGEQDLVIDWPGGHRGETTALQEQMCYWIADHLNLPWSHRHTIRFHVNGVTDEARQATFEAVVQPARGFVKEWSPNDSGGELFKIERAFEFSDTGVLVNDPEPRLQVYTTTGGVKKRERYRWNWMFRATDRRNDYTNIFALVDAVNSQAPEPYTSATLGLVDMEEWMGIFATEHIIENFDAYGHVIGKNMYAYLPPSGKWQLYMFDLDWAMLAAPNFSSMYTASAGPLFNAEDPTITAMYAFPPFARAYWRAVQNAVNGPFDPANCNPVIDAKSRSLFANGIKWCDGQPLTPPDAVKTWFSQRRDALQGQLATVASPFSIDSVVVSNNVALIGGRAPVGVQTVAFNGDSWPLTWNSVTGWVATVVLHVGTNQFSVVGLDPQGQWVPGASNTVSAVYNGALTSPAGQVVINEIMCNPPIPGAEYVELFNNSSSVTFDLSAWQLKGLAYTFPAGSLIGPNGYLVLAANRATFAAAYGATNLVFDVFSGTLQNNGETLSLIQPGTNAASDVVVAKVRYRTTGPWPLGGNKVGSSLQLIDSHQDNWRAGNWAAVSGTSAATPGATNSDAVALPPFPPLWINEVQADNLTGITNGAGQRSGWLELFNPTTSTVSLSGLYLSTNYSSLTAWMFPPGATIKPGEFKVIFTDGQVALSTTNELHTTFALSSGSGSLALTRLYQGQPQVLDYLDYTNLAPDHSYGSVPDAQSFDRQEFALVTPGSSNNTVFLSSFIPYSTVGELYTQEFDSLPNPGFTSVNTANPVTINGITYSLANPFDFAFPVVASGGSGGLGIGSMAGWYGRSALLAKFGATDGDQTTGGQISFGLPGSPNRSLGLLATSSTGATAFGAKLINQTGQDLRYITLSFTGELWRQSDLPKTLEFYYFIDPTATTPFPATATAFVPSLNLSFSTSAAAVGGVAVDGTSKMNQVNLGVLNQAVTNWPMGAALWLVWEMPDSTGKSQGLAIDHLTFTAADQPLQDVGPGLSIEAFGRNLVMSWHSVPGQTYHIEYKDDLNAGTWTVLGSTLVGNGSLLTVTNDLTASSQRYYRLRLSP
jgi:hypothetical protein